MAVDWYTEDDAESLGVGFSQQELKEFVDGQSALPILEGDNLIGCVANGHSEDLSLSADVVLENLTAKSSAAIALRLLVGASQGGSDIDYVMGCGEEAIGDRYQRGGGNLAKWKYLQGAIYYIYGRHIYIIYSYIIYRRWKK